MDKNKLIILVIGLCLATYINKAKTHEVIVRQPVQSSLKQAAYRVLESKCNGCHREKNPRKVFTSDNMNEWSQKIYRQVFIKKRMPKTGGRPLTQQEYTRLKAWLDTQTLN